jgi:hypothetical protein
VLFCAFIHSDASIIDSMHNVRKFGHRVSFGYFFHNATTKKEGNMTQGYNSDADLLHGLFFK